MNIIILQECTRRSIDSCYILTDINTFTCTKDYFDFQKKMRNIIIFQLMKNHMELVSLYQATLGS